MVTVVGPWGLLAPAPGSPACHRAWLLGVRSGGGAAVCRPQTSGSTPGTRPLLSAKVKAQTCFADRPKHLCSPLDPLPLSGHRVVCPQGKSDLSGVSLGRLPNRGQLSKPLSP